MKEFLVFNEDNSSSKNYGIYYTINDRFYVIYTNMEKDENNYVILHIAKVLKEVNNTPDGIVPTGRYIGIDMPDQSEWDNVKTNISEIIANKQNNAETSVTYLPINEIDGINVKSSKSFRLVENIVNSIIIKDDSKEEIVDTQLPVVDEPIADTPAQIPAAEEPVAQVNGFVPVDLPSLDDELSINSSDDFASIPAMAPNPFEMNAEPVIPEPVVEEKPINPYDVLQQQREEEMLNTLATDDMKDIVSTPAIPVNELESKINDSNIEIPSVVENNQPALEDVKEDTNSVIENTDSILEATEEPVVPEPVSTESFVDSIIADVSDILDHKEEPVVDTKITEEKSEEEKADYEQLYNDALEKTVELEKELKELHSKLNNIKNIVE